MKKSVGQVSEQRIVLTGATGGVGRVVAERLAREGADLALVARREDVLSELASELGARAVPADVSDEGFAAKLASQLAAVWGAPPDVVINNAGVFDIAPVESTDPLAFEQHLTVNLVAPFRLIRLWLGDMVRRGSGQIVNIGSIAGRKAFPGNAAYSASKFGLRGLHEVLVEEVKGTGVRVTWVEPSAIDTPLWDPLDPDRRVDLPSRAEMLRPESVAEAVYFAIRQPEDVSVEEIVLRTNLVQ